MRMGNSGMENTTSRTIRLNGLTVTFEVGERGYILRSLSNHSGTTASITIPLHDNRMTQYTLRPFQKMVVYPPVGVAEDTIASFTASI